MSDKIKLTVLHAKKNALFSRLQNVYERSKNIEDEGIREMFLSDIETLDLLKANFEGILDQICEKELELNPAYNADYQSLVSFEEIYSHISRIARKLSSDGVKTESSYASCSQFKGNRLKLPAIEIPEFNGDIRDWPLFFASFSNTVNNNPSLSDSEKLYYLIGKLTGKARLVCVGINPCAENYEIIWQSLIDKFEDKRLLATSYLDQLFDLKPITSPTANNIELFVDKFASCVCAFRNLKLENMAEFMFLYMALKKLDSETVKTFELNRNSASKSTLPTYEELLIFLRDHVKLLNRLVSPKFEIGNSSKSKPSNSRQVKATHTYVSASVEKAPIEKCTLCNSSHEHLYLCSVFSKWPVADRFKFVKKRRFCYNCLSQYHRSANCQSKKVCLKCRNRHHTLLHFENNYTPIDSTTTRQGQTHLSTPRSTPADVNTPFKVLSDGDVTLCTLSNATAVSATNGTPSTVLLATARVIVVNAYGEECLVRVLLDSASQSNFITRTCCNRLGFKKFTRSPCNVVKGIGSTAQLIHGSINVTLYSRFNCDLKYDIKSLVVDKVTEQLPTVAVDSSTFCNFTHLNLADDTYAIPGDIDMLVGASLFPQLLLSNRIKGSPAANSPHALETRLGYVIVGNAPAVFASNSNIFCYCSFDSLDYTLRKFWEQEEVTGTPLLHPDDEECENFYVRTTKREENGRYTVALPFKGDTSSLGDSYHHAKRRYLYLERTLQAKPELKTAYNDVIREQLEKGYLSPARLDKDGDLASYFIPHRMVLKDSSSTSLRVVLNASAPTSTSVSLNDILHKGPDLQGNLFNILINFRLFRIALSADIRQMYMCIGVRECDRKYQRILYRFSPQEDLNIFEYNRVCFGVKSSPFHALRTIRKLVSDEGDNYPKAKTTLDIGLYMDDFVYSLDGEKEAASTATDVIALMKSGQFDLVKWTSNSSVVLESIPPSHRLSTMKTFDDDGSHKVLGLCWHPSSDLFSLRTSATTGSCTKRNMLSCIARLWDVMGFVAPVVLFAKLLIKQLWLCKCDWDDSPPVHIEKAWAQFKKELPLLNSLDIPRHVGILSDSIVNIVGFADASEKAYGAVVYLHVKNVGRPNSVFLVCAKSKVSPVKVISIARLELSAALVLSKLLRIVLDICSKRLKIEEVYAFSDSTVALCWIHSSPHRWATFVANRVTKIHAELPPHNFLHVSGNNNPADCLSRGLTPAQILDHPLWFSGPTWLKLDPSDWPVSRFDQASIVEPPEQKSVCLVTLMERNSFLLLSLADRFSSWSKLLRCIVFVYRFLNKLPNQGSVTSSDLMFAEFKLLGELQSFHFREDIRNLKSNNICSRKLQCLKPFLKEDLIRVGGRLRYSELEYGHKHPIVLPRKDHVVSLLIEYTHKINCHAGPDLLMAILRQNYWILSARGLIRSIVRKCNRCFRLRPKPTFPEMADHNSARVVQSVKPFVFTGSDFAGPLKVTVSRGRGIRSTKAYICLFVCLTTRAIHIELAGDLSTACFIGALNRFLSRRGPVSCLYTDNGTNYIGAKRYLSELQQFLRSKHHRTEFEHTLAKNRIDWKLNAPTACHFGGNWEANIKSLKTHLFRVIGDQILTFEELSTVLAQIESVMNSRPLCRTLSNDPSEPLALTPSHFLNYTPLKYLPSPDMEDDNLHLSSRHALLVRLVQSFWNRWRREYLHTLQTRLKWNTPVNPITKGTVVILINDNTPPLHWPLGIVEEVFPAKDGIVRVVRVKTSVGTYLRPVVRLCPLPNQ